MDGLQPAQYSEQLSLRPATAIKIRKSLAGNYWLLIPIIMDHCQLLVILLSIYQIPLP